MALTTIAALAAGGLSLLGSGISSYLNWQRNKTLDEREDTSIQRRMEDLRKSGLNPYLALGQGAGASQGIGMNFDTSQAGNFMQTMYETKNNREMYKQNQLYTKLMETQLADAQSDYAIKQEQNRILYGMNFGGSPFNRYDWLGNFKGYNSSYETHNENYERFRDTLLNNLQSDYKQSLFDLKTQGYRNSLELTKDTLQPLIQLGGLLNPIGNFYTSLMGRKNFNTSQFTGSWQSENRNYNYNYRQK